MRRLALAALSLVVASPVQAEVVSSADNGFVIRQAAEVSASPEDAWKTLVAPAGWWSGAHSFSGDAKNLSIDPRAGGCFCEILPGEDGAKEPRGGVEHLRVVFADRGKALRMVGALGPLQSEALQGTLTITLKPVEGGTQIVWSYVVAGFMRYKAEQIVPAVDKVLGEQAGRLAEKLGTKASSEAPKPEPGMESGR